MFENLDFWTFDHCILYSFLRGFSLWQRGIDSTKQMMVYDQITFFIKCSICVFFLIFLGVQKTWENIAKSAGNANLPRIPSNPVAYQPRGLLCYIIGPNTKTTNTWNPNKHRKSRTNQDLIKSVPNTKPGARAPHPRWLFLHIS